MIIIKKLYKILTQIGKGATFIILLFCVSSIIVSYPIKKQEVVTLCKSNYENVTIDENIPSLLKIEYKYKCDSIDINLEVLSKNDIESVLVNIKNQLIEKYIECYVNVLIDSKDMDTCVFASINLSEDKIYYMGSFIP